MLKRIQHPFQSARSDFQGARNEFQGAKSNFQAAKIDFQGAKIDFQGAKSWSHQNSVGSIRITGYITAEPKGTDSTLRLQKSFGKSIQEEGVGGF